MPKPPSPTQFRRLARLGRGEALLLLRAAPALARSPAAADIIADVTLRNYAYSAQSEGSRAAYAHALYLAAGSPRAVRDALLNQLLAQEALTDNDLSQAIRFATTLAQAGDTEVARAIRAYAYRNFDQHQAPIAIDALISLDGLDGAAAAARLIEGLHAGDDTHIIHYYEHELAKAPLPDGVEDIWQALEQLARAGEDAQLDAFLARRRRHLAWRAQRPDRAWSPPTRQDALDRLREGTSVLLGNLSRSLTPADLDPLAHQLPTTRSPKKREQLLSVFSRRVFPGDPAVLLALEPRTHGRARHFVWAALERLSDPRIRERAERRLRSTTRPGYYLRAFLQYDRPGDEDFLAALTARTHAEHTLEEIALATTAHYREHPTLTCRAPLLTLYEKMTCSVCRLSVVRLLDENGGVPPAIATALPHDSYAETRAFAKF